MFIIIKAGEVIILKNILVTTIFSFLIIFSYSSILAKTDKSQNTNKPVKNFVTGELNSDEEDVEEPLSPSEKAKERNTVRKLNMILEKTNNPDVEEEVEEIVEDQEEAEENAEEAIDNADKRPSYVKFLIGPDFNNLGQLRKEVVQTRNNIRKLEQLRLKAEEGVREPIDAAMAEIETKAQVLQEDMNERLSGFSLFGWLTRWLSDFSSSTEPEIEELVPTLPTVTGEPTGTPEGTPASTGEPTSTPEASLLPTATPKDTLEPIATPI